MRDKVLSYAKGLWCVEAKHVTKFSVEMGFQAEDLTR